MYIEIDPTGQATTTTYDMWGRVDTITDRDGRVRVYNCDSADRLEAETWYAYAGASLPLD